MESLLYNRYKSYKGSQMYEFELELTKKINRMHPSKISNEDKKKRRELFHLLVFMNSLGEYRKYLKYRVIFSERPDFILKKIFSKRIGVEITEVIDFYQNNKKMNDYLDNLLEQGNKIQSKDPLIQKCSKDAKEKIKEQCNKKAHKLNEKGWNKFDKNILLLVTMESEDNPCNVTGFWFERVLIKNEILELKKGFSDIYVLNYSASSRDNGPIVVDMDEIIKYREMLHSE